MIVYKNGYPFLHTSRPFLFLMLLCKDTNISMSFLTFCPYTLHDTEFFQQIHICKQEKIVDIIGIFEGLFCFAIVIIHMLLEFVIILVAVSSKYFRLFIFLLATSGAALIGLKQQLQKRLQQIQYWQTSTFFHL